jgi:hypothetical protein
MRRLHEGGDCMSSLTVKPESILTVVTDDHSVHCMTEPMLDTWWASSSPELKAEIFESSLECNGEPVARGYREVAERFVDRDGFIRVTQDQFEGLLKDAYQILQRKPQ